MPSPADGPEERTFEADEHELAAYDDLAIEEQLGDEANDLPENWL